MLLSIDAGTVKEYAVLFGALLSAIVFGTYWVPKLIVSLLPTQNLKKKYDAEWALVTGSSSGIGKSIAFALAKQGERRARGPPGAAGRDLRGAQGVVR